MTRLTRRSAICVGKKPTALRSVPNAAAWMSTSSPRAGSSACRHRFSVTSGTIFHGRKLKFVDLLEAVCILMNGAKGISAPQLARDIDVQHKTACGLSHKIREALAAETNGHQLTGIGRQFDRALHRQPHHHRPVQCRRRLGQDAAAGGARQSADAARRAVGPARRARLPGGPLHRGRSAHDHAAADSPAPDLIAQMPVLEAYRQRCEARPAFQKALDAQMADFAEAPAAA